MIVSIIDFETTGLIIPELEITEIGGILYDWKHDEILRTFSRFIKPETPLTDEIIEITGITPSMLNDFGVTKYQAFHELIDTFYTQEFPRPLIQKPLPEFFVGHNSSFFDELVFKRYIRELWPSSEYYENRYCTVPWIDTRSDLPWSKKFKSKTLAHLCADTGYLLQNAHRALFDCMGCVHLLKQFSIDEVLEYKNEPSFELSVTCKEPWKDFALDGEKEMDIAKKHGFKTFDRKDKKWKQTVKERFLREIIDNCPLQIDAQQLSFVI